MENQKGFTKRKQYNMLIAHGENTINIYCYTDKEAIEQMTKQFMMLVEKGYNGFTFIMEEDSTKREIARFTI